MIAEWMQGPGHKEGFLGKSAEAMDEIYALEKAACQAAQFLFLCVGKCQSLYNRRFGRDKRSES